jgi:hypothetical protein
MGCGSSTLRVEKSGNAAASTKLKKQRESQLVRQLQLESTPDLLGAVGANTSPVLHHSKAGVVGANTRPVLTNNMVSTPQLVNQLNETTAVALAKGAKRGAGVHHLKNVFAAPLDDVTSMQAPVFPKGQAERAFIREALEKNFVFA